MKSTQNVNVLVVHGAWADGSSWSGVIRLLQARGSKVIAAPIPLTSLEDDITALQGAIERTEGPVVLAAMIDPATQRFLAQRMTGKGAIGEG